MSEYKDYIMNAFQIAVDTLEDVSAKDFNAADKKFYFSFKTLRSMLDNATEINKIADLRGIVSKSLAMCKAMLAQSDKLSKSTETTLLVSGISDIMGNVAKALKAMKE